MKASSIGLLFKTGRSRNDSEKNQKCGKDSPNNDVKSDTGDVSSEGTSYIINLIDSPGHVDFCSEVSTSVRLSDGALVIVDACEGVCIQTYAVLRQVWDEKLRPILVVNKLDRLINELGMSAYECYNQCDRIVRDVNSIISMFQSEEFLSQADAFMTHVTASNSTSHNVLSDAGNTNESEVEAYMMDLEADQEDAFSVIKGNVIFASAIDGWAFRTSQFAAMYAAKLGCSERVLEKALWGNYFYNPKTKKIISKRSSSLNQQKTKPLFVQFVLDPIYKAYSLAQMEDNAESEMQKMCSKLNITISKRDIQNARGKNAVKTFMRSWLPLSKSVMEAIVEILPSPIEAASYRMDHLMPQLSNEMKIDVCATTEAEMAVIEAACQSCDCSYCSPTIGFVSKIIPFPKEVVDAARKRGGFDNVVTPSQEEGEYDFLGFCRIFCGNLEIGQKLYVIHSNYDPRLLHLDTQNTAIDSNDLQVVTIQGIFMMMGTGLEPLQTAVAGSIVVLDGISMAILKSATISSSRYCRPLCSMSFQSAPLVRVAIEPKDPTKMQELATGMHLLNRADPFVEISFQDTGEHVLGAAGEVHLETCIKDLQERFAKIELEVSEPLVSFRESLEMIKPVCKDSSERSSTEEEPMWYPITNLQVTSGMASVQVKVAPMDTPFARAIEEMQEVLKPLLIGEDGQHSGLTGMEGLGTTIIKKAEVFAHKDVSPENLLDDQTNVNEEDKTLLSDRIKWVLSRACALGPGKCGANVLVADRPRHLEQENTNTIRAQPSASRILGMIDADSTISKTTQERLHEERGSLASMIESGIITGFQLATAAGPLCEEPMWGVVFSIDIILHSDESEIRSSEEQFGPFSGQLISAVRDGCRAAVRSSAPRLVEALYLCEATTTAETLGNTYAVLGRRRSKILREEMQEGTGLFSVHAFLPVAASFNFADELRRSTSGAASAQLVMSHWVRLEIDPYFVPTTFEEREEHGEGGETGPNTAKSLIDSVRRRKGLYVQEKVVEKATKQRTLARKV